MCGKNLPYLTFQQAELGSPSRVREKRDKIWGAVYSNLGSHPRVREKLCDWIRVNLVVRITPACAGKTQSYWLGRCESQDHPRVCGKNFTCSASTKIALGSPPRVREKRSIPRKVDKTCGITPACAGKTPCDREDSRWIRDHPRVCGKNHKNHISVLLVIGSPPTCAGKTLSEKVSCCSRQDHPRVCGKNFSMPMS